ncbi:hypothetical protein Ahy_A08g040529 isoform C [Arachis hypogaea]|uniref:Uncharacterized protein n=1 Tax=Arachis hypogaea TaxID=3818 RepID=A0A445C043_ARAHY|nr:hypothetical protein Ahy_A08g040529 isoform C [Arachis hypogaea]
MSEEQRQQHLVKRCASYRESISRGKQIHTSKGIAAVSVNDTPSSSSILPTLSLSLSLSLSAYVHPSSFQGVPVDTILINGLVKMNTVLFDTIDVGTP